MMKWIAGAAMAAALGGAGAGLAAASHVEGLAASAPEVCVMVERSAFRGDAMGGPRPRPSGFELSVPQLSCF